MRKILFFVVIIMFLFIINNFFHSIYGLWQKQDLIIEARKELTTAKQEHRALEKELQVVSKASYIEEEARNKLLMVKPGEEVVVLPPTPSVVPTEKRAARKQAPAWEQWYQLLF